ncbi:hypothetical protein CLU85_4329 [Acidovorax sp. 69]|uniref:DUF2946 family protein n=1 Tax=Acidovorax sp. 69 TaxID=2035202 RepID=UPI000C243EC6|nr:DUF2946 family protein [Acidovorax sp. 69]PJI99479.1 hypothetical protein CLU85_4329 [Acidovorax sp. 69]
MDDIVKQALAKWPNVPDCYGWLGLDARGHWYLRDDAAQAAGPFPRSKGSLLQHDKLIAFIERNYESDAQGRWFFQNGPQRVYVELEVTPWVWRLHPEDYSATSHTGRKAVVRDCLVDERGLVYLTSDIGVGLVHTLDVAIAAEAVDAGHWMPQSVIADEMPARYGYCRSPSCSRPSSAMLPAQ